MKLVDSSSGLSEAVHQIAASPWAAVDTEADSLHHYEEKLCLVQISIPGEDWVIDPLAIDARPLASALGGKKLFLHGADFDLRMLKKGFGFRASEIFDTMIAAQLLGYDRQGLADLALRHCGVALSKSFQKADWSIRPLPDELLVYAANDTRHLKTISDRMQAELQSLGRFDWQRQSCERLVSTLAELDERTADPETDWQIKGSKKLRGCGPVILRELWNWRDKEARRRDRPPFKILHSRTLLEIAEWACAVSPADVADLPTAPRNVKGEYRAALNEIIDRARQMPEVRFAPPDKKPGKPWTPRMAEIFASLKIEKEKLAAELKIHPSLLGTNATLETLVSHAPKDRAALEALGCFMPWQASLVAEDFLRVLQITGPGPMGTGSS